MIEIGKVLKAQGIKGELKVSVSTEYKDLFCDIKEIFIDNKSYKIINSRENKFIFIKLEGVDDRNGAEAFHSKSISIPKEYLPDLKEHEYYFEDIINSEVYLDDTLIGRLVDIGQYGAADVHTIKTLDNKYIRYPFLKILIKNIDIKSKKICYHKDKFEQVSVMDDV